MFLTSLLTAANANALGETPLATGNGIVRTEFHNLFFFCIVSVHVVDSKMFFEFGWHAFGSTKAREVVLNV